MAAFCGFVIMEEYGTFLAEETVRRKLGRTEGSMDITLDIETITPFAEICPAEYPPRHSVLHDRRDHEVHYYNATYGDFVDKFNYWMDKNYEYPDIMQYNNYKYAIWNPQLSDEAKESAASAWDATDDLKFVQGEGWVTPPKYDEADVIELEGNFVGYNSWFPGNFGHFAHDWLPTIALLRHVVPSDTKFILLDNKMSRKFLEFLDPDFYKNRIVWAPHSTVYHIKGQLTVHIPLGIPDPIFGCCSGWDPMRQWIAEKHPERTPKDEKYVIWHTRKGNSDAKHGRVLDPSIEAQALKQVEAKLKQHKKNETIVIFDGRDENGETMSIEDQFAVFRGAFAFIGPHGSGFGGNYIWTDPFASKCDERFQYLEFMPGPENPQIHDKYAHYFANIRKWPFDYHTLLYTKHSTKEITQIDLETLDDALDAMWGTPETLNVTSVEEEETSEKPEEVVKEEEKSDKEVEEKSDKEVEEKSAETAEEEPAATDAKPAEKTSTEIDATIDKVTESISKEIDATIAKEENKAMPEEKPAVAAQ
eukprot:CAMPEP_0178937030 /NCGR_PEP_ID=MMETSP0786-20121207/25514_1 /TAXON_ID=186022 /ORGANISM="Thalassionema frauenfeldii, Strain CCMP 1798" /LENGTH=532 /DNA_ID=CAMNT_0020615523 /DNA_START=70 /DNA_END=1668 /DNA_ORIENTATION=-